MAWSLFWAWAVAVQSVRQLSRAAVTVLAVAASVVEVVLVGGSAAAALAAAVVSAAVAGLAAEDLAAVAAEVRRSVRGSMKRGAWHGFLVILIKIPL